MRISDSVLRYRWLLGRVLDMNRTESPSAEWDTEFERVIDELEQLWGMLSAPEQMEAINGDLDLLD